LLFFVKKKFEENLRKATIIKQSNLTLESKNSNLKKNSLLIKNLIYSYFTEQKDLTKFENIEELIIIFITK